METQKSLAELGRQMDDAVAEFEALGPAMRALPEVEFLVSFEDLKARFAPQVAPASYSFFNAVRA